MTNREDRALAALDVHFRTQLANAADTYASGTDIDARLQAVQASGEDNNCGGKAHVEG
jgi:hypothetical protein